MTATAVVWHMMRADIRERTRRYSFLMTMLGALYLAYAVYSDQIFIDLDNHRGVYNSAWLGMTLAMATTMFVSLVGFFVIKNTIQRDRQTRVGEVLATTPMRKIDYILGKVLSNFAVLMIIVGVQAAAALLMQILKTEDRQFDAFALFSPFVLLTMPAMAFLAAMAVLFESIRWLRGGLGNVVYIFVWSAMLAYPIEAQVTSADLSFMRPVQESMEKSIREHFTDYKGGFSLSAGGGKELAKRGVFLWRGMQWNAEFIAYRAAWFGHALVLALLASLLFDRFDISRSSGFERLKRGAEVPASPKEQRRTTRLARWLRSSGRLTFRSRFLQLTLAEFRLLVVGIPFWWHAVTLGLIIASVAAPVDAVKQGILPCLWLWPVLRWSGMGIREKLYRTDQMLFSSPRIISRQLPAMLLAGVLLAGATGGCFALRLAIAGDWPALGGMAAGALFIPSLALACGVWSGSSKTFEALYTFLWYIGPMNHVPACDYIGVSPTAIAAGMPAVFAVVALLLIAVAVAGRRRQVAIL